MYEEFLDKYCKHWGISEEEAKEHLIVKLFLAEKEKIDNEMSEMRGKDVRK